jgi:D-aspartate ligase
MHGQTVDPRTTPALLTMAHYPGTLAAARCLAARGVPVIAGSERLLSPAAWSRATAQTVSIPPMSDPDEILAWLLRFGARGAGMVLHPTCDDLAWLIARQASALGERFHLYAPPFEAIRAVLDKSELYAACGAVGVATPRTWLPTSEAEAMAIAREHGAVVVKPRSQVFFTSHSKGTMTSGSADVGRAWRALRTSPYSPMVRESSPGIELPMLQEYLPRASFGVYSVSGFIDRQGALYGARGEVKLLQRPKQVGIGLCFESATVEADLAEKLRALCRRVGYFGMFEAEFISDGERLLLIDFNPRYFNQMGLDIARGVPLPWMLHLGATGNDAAIETAVTDAAPGQPEPHAYRDGISLRWLLALGRAAGGVDSGEARRWRSWMKRHRGDTVDATMSRLDPLPGLVAALGTVYWSARHPRSSFRALQRRG